MHERYSLCENTFRGQAAVEKQQVLARVMERVTDMVLEVSKPSPMFLHRTHYTRYPL